MTQSNISLRAMTLKTGYSPRGVLRELDSRDAWLSRSGWFLLALLVPVFAASLFDPRLLEGTGVWIKPMKFLFSVGVYFLTAAWFMAYTRPEFQASRKRRWLSGLLVATGLYEALYITLQGGLGEASHFNQSDLLHGILYGLMGLGALVMTSMIGWQGLEIARHRRSTLTPVFRWSIAYGLLLTFLLTTIVGFTISGLGGPIVGIDRAASTGLWIFGWSREGGDLRVAHFIATHAMHILPLTGLWLAARTATLGRIGLVAAILSVIGLWGFTYWQALNGQPFFG